MVMTSMIFRIKCVTESISNHRIYLTACAAWDLAQRWSNTNPQWVLTTESIWHKKLTCTMRRKTRYPGSYFYFYCCSFLFTFHWNRFLHDAGRIANRVQVLAWTVQRIHLPKQICLSACVRSIPFFWINWRGTAALWDGKLPCVVQK